MTMPTTPPKKSFDPGPANAVFSDVAKHLRHVHERLLKLKKNPQDLASLYFVEQRFNAFRGTFAFFKTYTGFEEVMTLAQCIEDIGFTYRKLKSKEISGNHFDVLYRSVIACLKIFHEMKEGKPLPIETRNEYIKIKDARSVMYEIETKTHVGQTDADKILDDALSA